MVSEAVILAGGLGTRLSEETVSKPKPMIEIGGKPILWHIMKIYSMHGIKNFIICCGYKGEIIKNYFLRYQELSSDITVDLECNNVTIHRRSKEDWKVTLMDTGLETMTGGRLKAVSDFIKGETFCFTYGDGLGDVNVTNSIKLHYNKGALATMTVCAPPARFGAVNIENDFITKFIEKPKGDEGLINGGFFVLNKKCINYIKKSSTIWEQEPLEKLAREKKLVAYKHDGFWLPMDTLRDKDKLNQLWDSNKAPWKKW